jgi:hypothetical protein
MKKTLFIFIALFSLASCLKDGGFTDTRPVYATFEYSGMDYTKLFGKDSLFFESDAGYGLGWEYMAFLHKVDTSVTDNWIFQGGVMLSYLKGKTFDPADSLSMAQSDSLMSADNRFRANSLADPFFGRTYLVYHQNQDPALMPQHDIEFLASMVGTCQPLVCYVNNTNYVAYKVAQAFEDGDRLTLKATGYLKGAKTGEVSMELADFSAKKDSIVSTWTKFDLSDLASVDFVDFEVLSTKADVPGDFCLDYFVTSVTISY